MPSMTFWWLLLRLCSSQDTKVIQGVQINGNMIVGPNGQRYSWNNLFGGPRNSLSCDNPNTKRSLDNTQCICKEGFIGDTPVKDRGCWKCEPKCGINAHCEYPGRCICDGGYIRNGSGCVPTVPQLLSLLDIPNNFTNIVKANYKVQSSSPPFVAFCQINGSIKVAASLSSNSSLECLIPSDGICDVRISFDGIHWSNQLSYTPTRQRVSNPPRPVPQQSLPINLFVQLGLGVMIAIVSRNLRRKRSKSEDIEGILRQETAVGDTDAQIHRETRRRHPI